MHFLYNLLVWSIRVLPNAWGMPGTTTDIVYNQPSLLAVCVWQFPPCICFMVFSFWCGYFATTCNLAWTWYWTHRKLDHSVCVFRNQATKAPCWVCVYTYIPLEYYYFTTYILQLYSRGNLCRKYKKYVYTALMSNRAGRYC